MSSLPNRKVNLHNEYAYIKWVFRIPYIINNQGHMQYETSIFLV